MRNKLRAKAAECRHWVIGCIGIAKTIFFRPPWWKDLLLHLPGPLPYPMRQRLYRAAVALPKSAIVIQICDQQTRADETGSLAVGLVRSGTTVLALWPRRLCQQRVLSDENDVFADWHSTLLRLGLARNLKVDILEDWPAVLHSKSLAYVVPKDAALFLLDSPASPSPLVAIEPARQLVGGAQ